MELSPPSSPDASGSEPAKSPPGNPSAPENVAPTPPHVSRGRGNTHLPLSPSLRRLSADGVVKLDDHSKEVTKAGEEEEADPIIVEADESGPPSVPPPPAYHVAMQQSPDQVPPPGRTTPITPARLSRSTSRVAAASPNKGTPGLRKPGAKKVTNNLAAAPSVGAPGTPEQQRQQLQQKTGLAVGSNKLTTQSVSVEPSPPPQLPPRVSVGASGAAGEQTTRMPSVKKRKPMSTAVSPIDENSFVQAASPNAPVPRNSSKNIASDSGPSSGGSAPPLRAVPSRTSALGRRILDVEVVEAAGLLGVESGGLSNPRCDILLVNPAKTVLSSEGVRQTAVARGTVDPVWRLKVSFGRKANLSKLSNSPVLRVQVREKR